MAATGNSGSWHFTPVIDGTLIQQRPSHQLQQKLVNGQRLLVGGNSNEGPGFVPQNITTQDDLYGWLSATLPLFSSEDIAEVLATYPGSSATVNASTRKQATNGYTAPTAVDVSEFTTGQQQRANNIYAELTFACPGYWLAEAFSYGQRSAFKYQYSVPPGLHGQDVSAFFGSPSPNQGPDFVRALMTMVGNFVTVNNPSVPDAIVRTTAPNNPLKDWPQYHTKTPYLVNLNQSGGSPEILYTLFGSVTQSIGPGLRNNFTLGNAYEWEGGRGYRCDFWRSMGARVPDYS